MRNYRTLRRKEHTVRTAERAHAQSYAESEQPLSALISTVADATTLTIAPRIVSIFSAVAVAVVNSAIHTLALEPYFLRELTKSINVDLDIDLEVSKDVNAASNTADCNVASDNSISASDGNGIRCDKRCREGRRNKSEGSRSYSSEDAECTHSDLNECGGAKERKGSLRADARASPDELDEDNPAGAFWFYTCREPFFRFVARFPSRLAF